MRCYHPFDWWSVAVSPSCRTWRSWWGRTDPTGRASCSTSPRYTSTLRPERRQRPGGGGRTAAPSAISSSSTSSRHHCRSHDRLTFDPSVKWCSGESSVHVKCEKTKLWWIHQAALLLSYAHIASCAKQVWLSVSFAEMLLLGINRFLFF